MLGALRWKFCKEWNETEFGQSCLEKFTFFTAKSLLSKKEPKTSVILHILQTALHEAMCFRY